MMSSKKQEKRMGHKKVPIHGIFWMIGSLVALMLACNLPESLPQSQAEDMSAAGAIVNATLEVTEPPVSPTTAVLAQPHGLEAAPTAVNTPTPQAPEPDVETPIYYHVQPGTPIGMPNLWHKELGCEWMGIGGQVFGADGWPEDEILVVEIGGNLAGEPVSGISLTGTATQWGPSGYEFILAPEPVASEHTLWVQFFNIDGVEVSPRILFNTYASCEQNAVLLNMIHVERAEFERLFLPVLGRLFFPGTGN
jgi:hypothetical protein